MTDKVREALSAYNEFRDEIDVGESNAFCDGYEAGFRAGRAAMHNEVIESWNDIAPFVVAELRRMAKENEK